MFEIKRQPSVKCFILVIIPVIYVLYLVQTKTIHIGGTITTDSGGYGILANDKAESTDTKISELYVPNTSVPNDKTGSVPNDKTTSVPNNKTTSVPNDKTTSVPNDKTTSVANDNKISVKSRLKYILLWTNNIEPLSGFLKGQEAFNQFECAEKNCFVTSDRKYFGGNLSNFDAIMFNGQQLGKYLNAYPEKRYKHQKYVYANLEPPYKNPVCHTFLNGYFNWTVTYKLNSNIPFRYYTIIDKRTGLSVGPSIDIQWVEDMQDVDEEFARSLKTKTKAAAWNVNNCSSKDRNDFVKDLQGALKKFNLSVDVYGQCGPYKCPREKQAECNNKIKRDYYFYMALENSFYEDYVTEKVLHALSNNAIPIVFGGANYSRFLPPGSYLNGREHTAVELAAIMNLLIQSPNLYRQFFRWRNHYEFISTMPENQSGRRRMFSPTKYEGEGYCKFCEALNDEEKLRTETVYTDIRKWWNPDYAKFC